MAPLGARRAGDAPSSAHADHVATGDTLAKQACGAKVYRWNSSLAGGSCCNDGLGIFCFGGDKLCYDPDKLRQCFWIDIFILIFGRFLIIRPNAQQLSG